MLIALRSCCCSFVNSKNLSPILTFARPSAPQALTQAVCQNPQAAATAIAQVGLAPFYTLTSHFGRQPCTANQTEFSRPAPPHRRPLLLPRAAARPTPTPLPRWVLLSNSSSSFQNRVVAAGCWHVQKLNVLPPACDPRVQAVAQGLVNACNQCPQNVATALACES